MILKTLELENFQCYSGNNEFEFSKGLNVIIGDNGSGKSKLFDAFYWVLYDELFDSLEKEFKKTQYIKSKLISDKPKDELIDEGSVKSRVKLIFFNPKDEKEYSLERTYTIAKKRTDEGLKLIEPDRSQFTMFEKEYYQQTSKVVDNHDKIERIKKKILPDDIKPYMWFQGEEVDKLIDFKKKNTLTKAINTLSDISEFDDYISIASKALANANAEYKKELRRNNSHRKKFENLEKRRKTNDISIERLTKEKELIEENLYRAKEGYEKHLNKIDDAIKLESLYDKKISLESNLNALNESLTKAKIKYSKSLFTKNWVLKDMRKLQKNYAKKFGEYEEHKIKIKAEKEAEKKLLEKIEVQLDKNIPEPVYIVKMLKEERCMVCGQEAKKNSPAWNYLNNRILKDDAPKEEKLSKHNFQPELKKLYQDSLRTDGTIKRIDEEQENALVNIKNLNDERKTVSDDLKAIDEQIRYFEDATSLDKSISFDIRNENVSHHNSQIKYAKELTRVEIKIEQAKKQKEQIKADIAELEPDNLPSYLKERINVFEDFNNIAISTRDRVFNNLIKQLEQEANKHFVSMTSENKSTRGVIKLTKIPNGGYMPENQDSNGNKLYQLNASNILIIKIAVIMAIISAKKSTVATNLYTLIADAPVSIFGENYIMGFCKTVGNVYNQSIIMSKDFYSNEKLRKRLLDEVKDLGSVYLIEPSIREEERNNRNLLYTKYQKIN